MTYWNLQNADGTIVLRLEENDATGAMSGTLASDGSTYTVQGGWSASGSVPGRLASVFALRGSDEADAPTWIAASGVMMGPGAAPQRITLSISIASGHDGSLRRKNAELTPLGGGATRKRKIVVISDVHIGMGTPTVWFQPSVHDAYLKGICDWIIANAADVQEVVLLGDFFDQWTVPCDEQPPSIEAIIKANPQIFGPTGYLCQVLDALRGNVTFGPGNHDMWASANDMSFIASAAGHSPKFFEGGTYRPPMPDGGQKNIALAHGHEYTMFNAVDDASPWGGLPVGHFVTRMVASQMKRTLKPGQTVADLAGQGSPDGLDYTSIVKGAWARGDVNVVEALLDSVAAQTGTPKDQMFVLADGSSVSLAQVQSQYQGLFSQWQAKEGGGTQGTINAWKSVLADAQGYYMGFFGQRKAFEQSAEVVVFGHTHIPQSGLETTMVNYANSGFECASIPDMPPGGTQATTFIVIDGSTLEVSVMQCAQNGTQIAPINVGPVQAVPVGIDDSCYVKIINNGAEDLILKDQTAAHGYFAAPLPATIPAGEFGLVWLQDYAGGAGSQGSVTYSPAGGGPDQVFTFTCPLLLIYSNACSGGTSFRTKSGSGVWGAPGVVAKSGHPFYVEFTVA